MQLSLQHYIWQFIRKERFAMFTFITVALIWSIDLVLSPYLLKIIIDGVSNHPDDVPAFISATLYAAILYTSMSMIINILFRWYNYVWMQFAPRLKQTIIQNMFNSLTEHSYRYFQENFSGTLAKKLTDIGESIEGLVRQPTEVFFPRTIVLIFSATILLLVKPIFSLILLLWATVFLSYTISSAYRAEKYAKKFSETVTHVNGTIVDSVTNVISSKLFANEKYEQQRVRKGLDKVVAADRDMQWHMFFKVHFYQGLSITALISAMMYTLYYGRIHGDITVGDFAFVLALSVSIAQTLFNTGVELIRFTKDIGKANQALDILRTEVETPDAKNAKPIKVTRGEIQFNHVHFTHSEKHILFSDMNVTLNAGQKVGLVGYSGGGKTSFINLILRLFDVESGNILIDGQDISKVTKHSLRKSIAVIPQEPELFHRTILENIRYGRLEASDEEVINAAKQAHCHEFIEATPQGYQTLVGERGIKLSGGQRQRIAIARSILKDAPVQILDEATSSLDSVTENYIQQSLKSLMANKTTIVIAHRLSTLLEMDRILFFKEGQIIEDGTLEELRQQGGEFAKLWDMQGYGYLP